MEMNLTLHEETTRLDGVSAEKPERSPAEKWYALAVRPRHDKVVSTALEQKGYVTFLPLYKKKRQYAARFRESHLPLFPGYVFCRFNPVTRLPILTTPGVIQILGAGREPIPVDAEEIVSLQTALRTQALISPYPFVKAGQRVRVTEGPLAGVDGVVVELKPRLRVVLSITLLQRSVLLEIDRDYVSAEDVAA